MENIFLVLISAALVNNIVVGQLIGADPALSSTQRQETACGVSSVMLVLLPVLALLSTALTQFLLIPLQLEYLQTFSFVLLIILVTYGLSARQWKWSHRKWLHPAIQRGMENYLPLAAINTTVLGTVLLAQQIELSLFLSFFFGLGTALGFTLLLAILTAIETQLEMAEVPAAFKGQPITLITLGIISMAFLGFSGLVN